jgi:hypothetical protein
MYRQFNIQQFYVLPTQYIMCFVLISEQTAIISLHNINWLIYNWDLNREPVCFLMYYVEICNEHIWYSNRQL